MNSFVRYNIVMATALVSAILGCPRPLHAADAPNSELAWKWERGQQRRYEIIITRNQTTGADKVYKSELRLSSRLLITAMHSNENGVRLKIKLENLNVDQKAGKTHTYFDSESPSPSSSAWAVASDSMMNSIALAVQQAAGNCRLATGYGDLLSKDFSQANTGSPRTEFAIEQIFGDAGFEHLLNSIFGILPPPSDDPPAVWSNSNLIYLALGVKVRKTSSNRIDRIDSRRNLAVIITEGHITPATAGTDRIELPGGKAEIEIEQSSISSKSTFAIDDGALIGQESKGRLNIKTILFDKNPDAEKREVRSILFEHRRVTLVDNTEDDQ